MRCFVAVAEELNFGAAAARLLIAQPALTRTIKRLEERIGARLFDRDTRNVRLSAVGRAFLAEARSALLQVERAERVARDMARGRTGKMAIAYMNFVTQGCLAPILKRFNAAKPNVRVDLYSMGTEQQRRALVEKKIDVAFMLGPFTAPGIATRILREEEMMVFLTKNHPLTKKRVITPRDLQDENLIVGSQELWSVYRRIIFTEFDRAGISPLIAQEAPTPSAIFSLVSAGMGVTIFPKTASQFYRDWLDTRPFQMQHGSVTTICAWTKASENTELKTFLSCLPPER